MRFQEHWGVIRQGCVFKEKGRCHFGGGEGIVRDPVPLEGEGTRESEGVERMGET